MILHLSTQQTGGAALAALRLHHALLSSGQDSHFLAGSGEADPSRNIHVLPKIYERFWQRGLHRLGVPVTEQRRWQRTRAREQLPDTVLSGIESDRYLSGHPLVRQADIVHLHWIPGMFDWRDFFAGVKKPLVWTLHDMYPFLGVFHYEGDRSRAGQAAQTYDQRIRERKTGLLQHRPRVSCVAPSEWLGSRARTSGVLGQCAHRVLPNAIDARLFRPIPREFGRELFDLDPARKVALVVAERLDDYRKGMDLLVDTLERAPLGPAWQIVAVGRDTLDRDSGQIQSVGVISDQRLMAVLYSTADLTIIPSREDNLPNVILESLCCGTPVVGLPSGGLPEAVVPPRDGVIAREVSADALARALGEASSRSFDHDAIRQTAVERFDGPVVARAYAAVYDELLRGGR